MPVILFFSSCHIIAHPVGNFRSNPSSTGAVQQHCTHVSLLYMKHFLIYRYKINTSSFSKQLPTLILFQDGKEKIRRPAMSAKGTVLKHTFTKVCNLNQLYMRWRVTNQQNDCVLSKDSDQPDQSLCYLHEEALGPWLPIEPSAKTLIRLCGCPG